MKTIAAAEFKAGCLRLMDEVQRTRQTVVITKRGKPVARLVPVPAEKDDFIGRLKGKIKIVGDLAADPPEPWESSF